MINNILNRGNKKSDSIKLHDDDRNLISSPAQVANRFNRFFTDIASNRNKADINARLNFDPGRFEELLRPHSVHLNPTEFSEVYDKVKKHLKKSTLESKISALREYVNLKGSMLT